MKDVIERLIEYQELTYGEFETMDKKKYNKTKGNMKYHPPKEDFWEWFMGPAAIKDRYQESIERNKKSRTENKEFSQSFSPRYCLSCKRAWDRAIMGRGMKLEYYKDFPTYGMKRKDCPPCERSKNGKISKTVRSL